MNLPLEVNNLTKKFYRRFLFKPKETFVAVDDISFELQQGEILGFLGPNGSGKTTTIQMLLGLMIPSSGSIKYFGKNFLLNRSKCLNQVTFASSYVKLPALLSVYESLDLIGRFYDLSSYKRKQNIEFFLKSFDMWNFRNQRTETLSAGQSARVMLAKAFLPEPKIVLLDEPTAALDPEITLEVRKFILEQQNKYGTSILFTSHNMAEVMELCDRVLVLKNGKIIADNSPKQLAESVSSTTIHLYIPEKVNALEKYLKENNFDYDSSDGHFEIKIDEQDIPEFLQKLTLSGFHYSSISIDNPTLENYFLNIAKQQKGI